MTTYYNINPKFYVSVDCIICLLYKSDAADEL